MNPSAMSSPPPSESEFDEPAMPASEFDESPIVEAELVEEITGLNHLQKLDADVTTMEITTAELRVRVAKIFDAAQTYRKNQEDAMQEACKELVEKLAKKREPFQFEIGLAKRIIEHCTLKMNAWDRAELKRARDEQARKNQAIEEQNRKAIEKAQEQGKPMPMLKAPVMVPVAPAKVSTETGTTSRETFKNWTVTGGNTDGEIDEKKRKAVLGAIPDNDPRLKDIPRGQGYFLLNVKLIDTLVEAQQVIPGLVIYDDVQQKHRRKSSR